MARMGLPPRKGAWILAMVAATALPAPRAGAAQDVTAPISLVLEEGKKPPLIVAIAMDEVGLTSADLQRSQEQVAAILGLLPDRTRVMVASFAGDRRIVLPPTSDPAALSAALKGIQPGARGVALPDGLFDVVDALGRLDAEARAVVLVSAGRLREGDLQFEDPLNAATGRNIPIIALGVGQGDGKLLRRIARITSGEYIRLEVVDPSMLAHLLLPSAPPAARVAGSDAAQESPSPPAPRASSGLLGVAALFLILGAGLMLVVLALLIRRVLRPVPREAAATEGAPVVKEALLSTPPSSGPEAMIEGDEGGLEKTLVVNVNPTLRALSGPGAGKNFPLSRTGQTSIGRSRRNDIVVPEDAASAQHCRIDREGDSYVLHDLGATNGTWVNGTRTDRAILGHGDRLKVGETVFTVSLFGDRS